MARKVHRIREFGGGLNTYDEPGEIKSNELTSATNIDFSQKS